MFPGAQLIASERLTDSPFWQIVPEHQILILDPGEAAGIIVAVNTDVLINELLQAQSLLLALAEDVTKPPSAPSIILI